MGAINPEKVTTNEHVYAGEIALDGSNPTTVTVPGWTAITGVAVSLSNASAPGVGTSILTYATSANVVSIYAWKVTSSSDTTLVASTGTETVGYVLTGY